MNQWVTLPVVEWLQTYAPGDRLPPDLADPDFRPFSELEAHISGSKHALCTTLCNGFNRILEKLNAREYSMRSQVVGDTPIDSAAESDESADGSVDGREQLARESELALYCMHNRTSDRRTLSQLPPDEPRELSPQGVQDFISHESVVSCTQDALRAGEAATVWSQAEFLIDVGSRRPPPPPHAAEAEQDTFPGVLGSIQSQLIVNATEMSFRQHRPFVPMISIHRDRALFLRFDSAGVVASTLFNYVDDPEPLIVFIFRYVRMDRRDRGFDPTATPASPDEHETFCEMVDCGGTVREHVRVALKNAIDPSWPIHKLTINAPWSSDGETPVTVRPESPSSTREFLVGKPYYQSPSMFGKGTRGFVAYDVERKTVVFIKDCWRPDCGPNDLTEHQVYLELSQECAPRQPLYIPNLLGGGDVLDENAHVQKTLTNTTSAASRQGYPTPRMIHTRLVFKEVGRPLVSFADTRELASVIYDALQAHRRAWEQYGILHCDMSVENILILDVDRGPDAVHRAEASTIGLLCDWELAKRRSGIEHVDAEHATRSGTWQFMSAPLLRYPRKPHLLSDDLESAYHILNWSAFKFLSHEIEDPDDLRKRLYDFYDHASKGLSSFNKLEYVRNGYQFVSGLSCDENHPFQQLLNRLAKLLQQHYQNYPPQAIQQAALSGTFEYPKDPDEEQPAYSIPSDGSISLNDPKDPPPHLHNHLHFLDMFRSVLLLDQSRWPAITKTEDQVPDQSPSSSVGSKRSADDLEDMGPAGAIVKKQKTEARDVDTSGKVPEGTDRVSGSGGPSQDLRNPDAGTKPTSTCSDLRRQALLSSRSTSESDKTRARPKK